MTGGFVDAIGGLGGIATMGPSGADYTMVNGKLTYKPKQNIGAYAGAAIMGAAIGSNRGTKGMAGGAIGSMAGMGIGMALGGPVGGQIGAVAGGWLGSLLGKPKKQNDAAEEAIKSFNATPGKIDVTNNELQIVNRNLIALKEKFEPYPFRESYYFQARANAGIGSGKWGNITIEVNGATDPLTTAKAVSQAIAGYSMQGAV
jgi:hypothetical protein